MFFHICYCPLELFLGLQLLVGVAVIKQLTEDYHIFKDLRLFRARHLGVECKQNDVVLLPWELTNQQKRQTFNKQIHGNNLW